jgi:peptide/nickel transport system permease protein
LLGYLARRVVLLGLMLFGLLCITFVISHVAPGDPARLAAGPDATPSMVETIRTSYGLDRPLPIQFAQYLQGVVSGDFGRSLRTRETVASDLARYFPNTFELVTGAMLLAVGLGVPLGILSAVYRDTWVDQATRVVSVSGIAIPAFWAGLMLQLLVALDLGILPLGGRLGLMTAPPPPVTHLLVLDAILAGQWRVPTRCCRR